MQLLSELLSWMEPRAVMAVGAIAAFLTAGLLVVQVFSRRQDRPVVIALAVAMAMGAVALAASVHFFDDFSASHTRFVLWYSMAAHLSGMACVILLYRPNGVYTAVLVGAMVCLGGLLVWPEGIEARNWNNFCQFVLAAVTGVIVLRSNDALAPNFRWVFLGLCGLSVAGSLPRLLSLLDPSIGVPMSAATIDTNTYRLRALVWAITPALAYACVMGVIQTRSTKRLRDSVNTDILTGAHSRRYLLTAGQRLLERRVRDPQIRPVVLLIDVDYFKRVNDVWGHAAGDAVLKHCVACIREIIRQDDAIVARYGGEEFCVLLPDVTEANARELAERVRAQLANTPYVHNGEKIAVTVSVGVALHHEASTLSGLIDRADQHLYQAKHDGRDRVVYASNALVAV
jgi:diguanylate cyclase (GGDEF)-like protein